MQSRRVRIVLAVVAVFVSANNATAATEGGVRWIDDPEVAARESTRTGKPILLQVTATWCGYCHKMFRETYSDPAIVDSANNDFVCLRVDADQHKKLVDEIGIKALPTTVILTPNMQVAKKMTGYQSVSRLATTLRETRRLARQVPGQNRVVAKPAAGPQTTQPAAPPNQRQPRTDQRPAPSVSNQTSARVDRGVNPFETAATLPRVETKTVRPRIQSVSNSRTVPVAFDRMCLVTLFDERKIETGSLEYSSTHRGHKVYFASADARSRFNVQPDRYWPTLDGYCAVTYLDGNQQVHGNPVFGAVFRNRMWFFQTVEHMESFIANPTQYLPQRRTPRT